MQNYLEFKEQTEYLIKTIKEEILRCQKALELLENYLNNIYKKEEINILQLKTNKITSQDLKKEIEQKFNIESLSFKSRETPYIFARKIYCNIAKALFGESISSTTLAMDCYGTDDRKSILSHLRSWFPTSTNNAEYLKIYIDIMEANDKKVPQFKQRYMKLTSSDTLFITDRKNEFFTVKNNCQLKNYLNHEGELHEYFIALNKGDSLQYKGLRSDKDKVEKHYFVEPNKKDKVTVLIKTPDSNYFITEEVPRSGFFVSSHNNINELLNIDLE